MLKYFYLIRLVIVFDFKCDLKKFKGIKLVVTSDNIFNVFVEYIK